MPHAARSDAAGKPDGQDPAVTALTAVTAAAEESRRLLMRLRADPRNKDNVDALILLGAKLDENRAELVRIATDRRALAEAVTAGMAIGRARRLAAVR